MTKKLLIILLLIPHLEASELNLQQNVAFFNEAVFSVAIHFWCDLCGVSIVSEAMPSGGSHSKYDKNFRALLEANIEAGLRSRDIAIDIGVFESFVYQMRLHVNTFGSIEAASFYATT